MLHYLMKTKTTAFPRENEFSRYPTLSIKYNAHHLSESNSIIIQLPFNPSYTYNRSLQPYCLEKLWSEERHPNKFRIIWLCYNGYCLSLNGLGSSLGQWAHLFLPLGEDANYANRINGLNTTKQLLSATVISN